MEAHGAGRHGIKEESPQTIESLREPLIASHSEEVDDARGPAAGVELSEPVEAELRALYGLESRASALYGMVALEKMRKYSILGFSVPGGNTNLTISPVWAHRGPVDTDVA
jgi:hypothetical protein